MSPAELHADSIVIDGLIIAKWNRELFEDMRKGGLTMANCTVSVWEGFQQTVNSIASSQKLIRENSDLVIQVRNTADIRKAKELGKTGILFGFQNAHAFEDQIGYVEIFKQLGVGIVQMCYNTQNLVGTGCYERDGGLSGFGREIVAEMNRVGIMCDLSHVGSKTSEEVILESKKPVTYSHCLPSGLKEHPRNKSDAELKFIADHGGFADDDGMGVVDHQALADAGVGVDVDAEDLGDPHLEEIGEVMLAVLPEPVRDAVALRGLIALEVEDRLKQAMAGRVAVVDRDEIGAGRLENTGIIGEGLVRDLAQDGHRHLVRGELGRDPVGNRALQRLVMEDTGVDQPAHQRLVADGLFGFGGDAVPDWIDRGKFGAGRWHVSPSFAAWSLA